MTKIKICGLHTVEDVDAVNQFLPEYAGFVFAESKRQVTPEQAAAMKRRLDPHILAVGVFVNHDLDDILALLHQGVIDGVQLHGEENAAYLARLRHSFDGLLIRAIPVYDAVPGPLPPEVDYPLFDTGGAHRGGSGATFDWTLLKGVTTPFFLAGGLQPDNVAQAIRTLHPYCVDVSSGVETDGAKDLDKIRRLIQTTRRERG